MVRLLPFIARSTNILPISIVIPIKPIYAEKIFLGIKQAELRKRLPKEIEMGNSG